MHPYRRLIDRVGHRIRRGTLVVRFWDGTASVYGQGEPRAEIRLLRPGVVPGLLANPEMGFGEAYMRGDLEIAGSIEDFMSVVAANLHVLPPLLSSLRRLLAAVPIPRLFLGEREKRCIRHHYDLGNDFYRLWLDPTMTYSCAYFRTPGDDLETAQHRKIHHTLDKVCLRPGMHLLDIGCGWGSLLRAAADDYGADALGITLSEAQAAWFKESQRDRSTEANAEMLVENYRTLATRSRSFDRIVSVGMIEHVGRRNLPGFFDALRRLLRPGGLGLVHSITGLYEGPSNPWITRRIFPGGYIPTLRELISGLSGGALIVWDVENLGPHYALTLDRWAEAFDRHTEEVVDRYGMAFARMWRLYLRSCAATFRRGDQFVHQVLFSRGQPDGLPLTRSFLFFPGSSATVQWHGLGGFRPG